LKKNYDSLFKESEGLRKENNSRQDKINILTNDKNDMKNIIGKLTEVRVILNKYFSINFENFTPHERKVIQEVTRSMDLDQKPSTSELKEMYGQLNQNNNYTHRPNHKSSTNEENLPYNLSHLKEIEDIKNKYSQGYEQQPQRLQHNHNNKAFNSDEDEFWYQKRSNGLGSSTTKNYPNNQIMSSANKVPYQYGSSINSDGMNYSNKIRYKDKEIHDF